MTDSTDLDLKNNASSPLTKINVVVESTNHKSKSVQEEKFSQAESTTVSKTEVKELGGRGGLDPTRFGDWEKNGRCIDF